MISVLLAELGHNVIGLDLSPEMLRVCQSTADTQGLTNLRLVVGDAERPPREVGPVDAVISRHVLWTLLRPEDAVTAWVKLTKPGGRVLGLDGLWSAEATDFRHYPADIDMCLPLQRVRSLDPARNLWHRAGLGDIMAEELCWIDRVEQSHMPEDERQIFQHHTWYLVEGSRRPVT